MDEPKRSRGFVPLLFSAIIGAVYLGFMVPYQFFTAPANVEELADLVMGKVGFHVELSMVMPHLICFGAALFFNFLGALFLKRLLVLFSILLYGASIALFYPYGPFALAAILFSLIGMFRIRRKKHGKKHSAEVPAPPEETTSAPAQPAAPAPAQPTAPEPAQPAAAPTQPTATATPAQPAAPAPAQTTAPEPAQLAAAPTQPTATAAPAQPAAPAPAQTAESAPAQPAEAPAAESAANN